MTTKLPKLRGPWGFHRKLDARLTFEHSPGKQAKGIVYEVGIDGSFLVRPRTTPKEWTWDDLNDRRLGRVVPTFFLVDFNPSRVTHRRVHQLAEYNFDPDSLGTTLVEKIRNLTNRLLNPSAKACAWYVEQIRRLNVPIEEEFRNFRVFEFGQDCLYFTVSDNVYFAKAGWFCRLDNTGKVTGILSAPGRILTAFFHPLDRQRLLVSAEGYPQNDPRWQCLYELDLRTANYRVVNFPKPAGNDLFGSKIRLFPDHRIALVNRYGSSPKAGGCGSSTPTNRITNR
uniref:Uncharacterized protein n=1 Tax=candidate division WWE3 bacterium TaxID=2053526 RepID=A0A831Z0M3_UNCKA